MVKKNFETYSESEWERLDKGLYADVKGQKLRVLTSVVDQNEEELIEMIPMKASAGYTSGYADPDYLKVLPTFFLPFLYYTGLYRFIGGTPKRLLLCYHGVAPNPDFSINNRHMTVEQFERDLKFYKKN